MNKKISKTLLMWYKQSSRDLPWRQTSDPYKIWLSEIMLQQTQVNTVIPYYKAFIKAYPTVSDLAHAQMDDVLKCWEGLGYYSRAKRLIPCAKMVLDNYGGVFPRTLNEILKLPGVGPYTAGAILGIAYNVKAPAVDGNVLRVISRLDAYEGDIAKVKTRKEIEAKVMKIIPDDVRHFNQALMELGAMVCTPKTPKCDACPVRLYCKAYKNKSVERLPVKSKKSKSPIKQVNVTIMIKDDRYLMYQRSPEGLLGGFWAFPYTVEGDEKATAEWVLENFDIQLDQAIPLGCVKHVFTHQVWHMNVVQYRLKDIYKLGIDYPVSRWVTFEEMNELAITTAMKKVIQLLVENKNILKV